MLLVGAYLLIIGSNKPASSGMPGPGDRMILSKRSTSSSSIWSLRTTSISVAALEPEKCNELAEKAHELGMEVLLEIHSSEELAYINKGIDMVGINNRNLGTFFTDVENSFRLAGQLPQDSVLVSESGISDPEIVKRLRAAGFRGFLIGETFMKTQRPGETLQNFLQAIQ